MTVRTRSQKLAQEAFARVESRKKGDFADYETVARKFPALIHTCGLAQAVAFAFAQSKRQNDTPEGEYLADLAAVLRAGGHTEVSSADALASHTHGDPVSTYLRLSRDAIDAAAWLKRYAEALGQSPTPAPEVKR